MVAWGGEVLEVLEILGVLGVLGVGPFDFAQDRLVGPSTSLRTGWQAVDG